jgi:hypothetical protein
MGYESGPVKGARSYQEFRTVRTSSTETSSVGSVMVYDLTVDDCWTARRTKNDPVAEFPFAGIMWNNEKTANPGTYPVLTISGGYCPSIWLETGNGGTGGTLPGIAVSTGTSPLVNCPVHGYKAAAAGTQTGFAMPWLPNIANVAYLADPIGVALEAQAASATGTIKAFILRR